MASSSKYYLDDLKKSPLNKENFRVAERVCLLEGKHKEGHKPTNIIFLKMFPDRLKSPILQDASILESIDSRVHFFILLRPSQFWDCKIIHIIFITIISSR